MYYIMKVGYQKKLSIYKDVAKSVMSSINNLPKIKLLAESLTNFLNSIFTDKVFILKPGGVDIWIITTDDEKIISITTTFSNKIDVTLHNYYNYKEFLNFFFSVFDTDFIVVDINIEDIPHIISKLNIDNYNKFKEEYELKTDIKKYNI